MKNINACARFLYELRKNCIFLHAHRHFYLHDDDDDKIM